jgi:hypothetical protein
VIIDPAPEELAKLVKNDRFFVITLRLVASRDGDNVNYDSTIRIGDNVTGKGAFIEDLKPALNAQIEELESARKAKLAIKDIAVSAFKSVGEHVNSWTIYRIDKNRYSVRGPGLGWNGKIADGQWIYQVDKNEMIPLDSYAITLRNILQVNF